MPAIPRPSARRPQRRRERPEFTTASTSSRRMLEGDSGGSASDSAELIVRSPFGRRGFRDPYAHPEKKCEAGTVGEPGSRSSLQRAHLRRADLPDLEAAVTRVMQGDGSAFGTVVEATSQELVRMAARIVGSLSDAEDVVQEGYIKAYRAMMSGHFDRRSSTKTWLYRIVTRTAVDALRAKARAPVPRDALDDDAATGASPEAHLAL